MAQRLPIPASPEDITPHWLTEALRSTATIDASARVTEISKRTIDTEGAGQSSWGSDLSVAYSDAASDPPRRLFVKGMLPNLEMYAEYALAGFRHELIFYQRIGPRTDIRVPRFYYGDLSSDPAAAVIVMESLASDEFATMDSGLSLSDAKLVLDELAHLHGRWWNSAEIDEFPWAADFMKVVAADHYVPRVPGIWKRLKEETPDLLNDDTRELGDHLVERIGDVWVRLLSAPRTVIQLDSRIDNVAFRTRSSGRCAVLFDWVCGPGPAVWDLGLLLFTVLEGRALDGLPSLLEHYCSRLVAEGVDDYPVDRATEDLAVAALATFIARIYALGAALDLGRSHPRSALRRLAFERVARAVAYM